MITYSREDALRLKSLSHKVDSLAILNPPLFRRLSRDYMGLYINNNRGTRAGRSKHPTPFGIKYTIKRISCLQTIQAKKAAGKTLPNVLYTNARSLNATKIDELQTYATAHKVEVICISETWLDAQKETYSQTARILWPLL